LPETTCVHLDLPTGCLQACTASVNFVIDASTRCGITFNKLKIH
jgi:NADH:ubiquinone oxidoreductase subunit E